MRGRDDPDLSEPSGEARTFQFKPYDCLDVRGLSGRDISVAADELRSVLLDHFFFRYLDEQARSHPQATEGLIQRGKTIFSDDPLHLVRAVVEEIGEPLANIFPLQALALVWPDNKEAILLVSIGYSEQWYVSVAVAPFRLFAEEEVSETSVGSWPLFERRWQELPNDGSLQKSLEATLSGDLEKLVVLGFVDRAHDSAELPG